MFDIVRGKVLSIVLSLAVLLTFPVLAKATTAVASFQVGLAAWAGSGHQYPMDVAPFISNGRVYVPVHYLAAGLGATTLWYPSSQTVTLFNDSTRVVLTIGSTVETVNGNPQTMDVPPVIVNGRTMLPARWVGEAFGCEVDWIPQSQQVIVWPPQKNQGGQTHQNTQIVGVLPTTPTGLQAVNIPDINVQTNVLTNDVDVSWNPVSNATGYTLDESVWNSSTNTWGQWNVIATGSNYQTFNWHNNGQTQVGYALHNQPTGEMLEFFVSATNSVGTSQPSQPVEITVTSSNSTTPTSPLSLASATLPICIEGQPYNYTISASGGVPPYTYRITYGNLPDGMSLSSNGTISGTDPDETWAGTWGFTVTVTDSTGATASNTFSFPANANQPSVTGPTSNPSSTAITLNPLDTNSWEVNNYSWTYQGQQFTWQIGVPQDLIETEAFNQVPKITGFLWGYFHPIQRNKDYLNVIINDTASNQYIAHVADDLGIVAQSQGYDRFHEAEFIAHFVAIVPYKIINGNTEFPPQVIANGGDCVNKSILLISILRQLGYPCALLEIPKASHAVTGIGFTADQVPQGNLTYYTDNGVSYYFTDTTAAGDIGALTRQPSQLSEIDIYPAP